MQSYQCIYHIHDVSHQSNPRTAPACRSTVLLQHRGWFPQELSIGCRFLHILTLDLWTKILSATDTAQRGNISQKLLVSPGKTSFLLQTSLLPFEHIDHSLPTEKKLYGSTSNPRPLQQINLWTEETQRDSFNDEGGNHFDMKAYALSHLRRKHFRVRMAGISPVSGV